MYWWVRAKDAAGAQASWSDQGLFYTDLAAPTRVSPTGTLVSQTPEYGWQTVARATGYDLYVVDRTVKIQQWFTAAATNCASGTGTCSLAPPTPLVAIADTSVFTWWVQTGNETAGYAWSDPLTFTRLAAAVQIAPTGTVTTSTPTYQWYPVESATWYQLWVTDSVSGVRMQTWHTAAELGCSGLNSGCSVTPTIPVSGTVWWWVQAWSADNGYGPWSAGLQFVR